MPVKLFDLGLATNIIHMVPLGLYLAVVESLFINH